MKKIKVGVLGLGEVGTAIAEILEKKYEVFKKDLNFDRLGKEKIEVLHICIPYSNNFSKIVTDQIRISKPILVVIHSTIFPGTAQQLFEQTKIPTVHSPVMGTHPNLKKDIRSFVKIIGPTNKNSATLAVKHFKNLGIKTKVFKTSLESEIAKLLDTTYYGWNIIFAKIVWDICKKSKVDFENVYKQLNSIYNTGYSKSKPKVRRPVLDYKPGPIGGHCIVPNAQILEEFMSNPITEILLKQNKKF